MLMQETRPPSSASPYIVGLTGGIGSGKSTVTKMFRKLGVEIIDADEISRALTSDDTPLVQTVIQHFGTDILDQEGRLNRAALREIIFSNPREKAWLENLLHPAIRKEIRQKIAESESPYLIVVVPLLLESDNYDFVDRIVVIDASEASQVERVRQRDGNNEALIARIMASQATRTARLKAADDIIDNSSTLEALENRVKELHDSYMLLAQNKTA